MTEKKVRTGKLRVGDVITSKKFEYVQVDSEGELSVVPGDYHFADVKRSPGRRLAKFVVEEVTEVPYHGDPMGGYGWDAHKEFVARKLKDGKHSKRALAIRFSEPYGATTDVRRVRLVGRMRVVERRFVPRAAS